LVERKSKKRGGNRKNLKIVEKKVGKNKRNVLIAE
jgi:hypothetical protein